MFKIIEAIRELNANFAEGATTRSKNIDIFRGKYLTG